MVTLSCVKYIAGVILGRVETLDPDKSMLLKVPPVVDFVSIAVLLRTVMDSTSRLLAREFFADLRFANESLTFHLLRDPTQAIDLFGRHQSATFTHEERDDSLRFARTICRKPYTESYALILSSLHTDSIVINGVRGPIPRIPREAWGNIVLEYPWVPSYLDSAGENYHACSSMIRGHTWTPMWTLADLDLALNLSSFSSVAQDGLRWYMNAHPSTESFLKRVKPISAGGEGECKDKDD